VSSAFVSLSFSFSSSSKSSQLSLTSTSSSSPSHLADNDWDEDTFEPVSFADPSVVAKWDGEDEDVEVKDNWEDFDEEEKEKDNETKADDTAQPVKVKKKKLLEKAIAEKEIKKKGKTDEKLQPDQPQESLTPEELIAEKLRRQRLQEESDLQLAKEAFGIDGANDNKNGVESMCPSSKDDFDTYRKALVDTLSKHEKSTFYLPFLDDFFRELCLNLEADEVKKLGNTLHVLANEKVKANKAANKGKKKGKAKASLVLGKADDYDYGGEYEPQNEFDDFM